MADVEGLWTTIPHRDDWTVSVAGIRREQSGDLMADVVVSNGQPIHADRIALNRPIGRTELAVAAAQSNGPSVNEIESALLSLVEPALNAVQETGGKRSQADLLVDLADEVDLFHDRGGEAYATIPVGDHRETHAVRTRGFRDWMARRFYETHGKAPGSQAVQDAITVLEGIAKFSGPECDVAARLAAANDSIYLDLANDGWEVVEITAKGWRIETDPSVRFRRPKGMVRLPRPERGGSLDELWRFVNITEPSERVLFVAWLIQALRPTGPYPALAIHGEQGSAKSTASRIARRLVDPNVAPLRSQPRSEHDLLFAATNGLVVGFDNLSNVPVWLSDALCRLSTGGGMSTRQLYSDAEESLFDAQRPVILNGITDLATRADS